MFSKTICSSQTKNLLQEEMKRTVQHFNFHQKGYVGEKHIHPRQVFSWECINHKFPTLVLRLQAKDANNFCFKFGKLKIIIFCLK